MNSRKKAFQAVGTRLEARVVQEKRKHGDMK
jgi:hypothetical protein